MQDVYIKLSLSDANWYKLRCMYDYARSPSWRDSWDFDLSFSQEGINATGLVLPLRAKIKASYNTPGAPWREIDIVDGTVHNPRFFFGRYGEVPPDWVLEEERQPKNPKGKVHDGERVRVSKKKVLSGSIRRDTPLLSPLGLGYPARKKAGTVRNYQYKRKKRIVKGSK